MSLHAAPAESTPLSAMFSLKGKVCLITGGNRSALTPLLRSGPARC